jgi:hypothetical protein
MKNNLKAALEASKKETEETIEFKKVSRKDSVMISAHVSTNIHKQLRFLAIEESKKQQDLFVEALNLLFVKYGKGKL